MNRAAANARPCTKCGGTPRIKNMSWCAPCERQRSRKRYAENREANIAAASAWNKANRDKVAAAARVRRSNDPERHQAVRADWNMRNRDRIAEYRRRREFANRSIGPSDPLSAEEWETILAIHGHRCMYCGCADDLTQDHFWPVSKMGPHEAENIVPACRSCNSSKGNRDPLDFCRKKGVDVRVLEADIQAEILLYLSAIPGTLVWRQNAGAMLTPRGALLRVGPTGVADIVGVMNGRAIAVEVKSAKGRQSPAQQRFQKRWTECGGFYSLARSVEEVRADLAREGLA